MKIIHEIEQDQPKKINPVKKIKKSQPTKNREPRGMEDMSVEEWFEYMNTPIGK